jgi:hypothetical protein
MILKEDKKTRVQLLDPVTGKSKTFTIYGADTKQLEKLIKESIKSK